MNEFSLTLDDAGRLGRITVTNPARRNAITRDMWQQLPQLLTRAKAAQVLLITGEGSHFSAGADIHEMGQLQNDPAATTEFRQTMQRALDALRDFPVPTIAWINGTCFGAGLALAMACDVRFADNTARFSVPPAKLGLLYPKADIDQLAALVGPAMAKQFLFTGEIFSTETAARTGLINGEQTMDKTLELIKIMRGNSAHSIASLKALVDGNLPDPDAAFDACYAGTDFAEGLAAFAAKRRPEY